VAEERGRRNLEGEFRVSSVSKSVCGKFMSNPESSSPSIQLFLNLTVGSEDISLLNIT
jgi:hypothetical protein